LNQKERHEIAKDMKDQSWTSIVKTS
jgi:hypothetical protein